MKKLLSLFLSLVMLMSAAVPFPASAETTLAESGSCGDYATYTFDAETGELVISGSGAIGDCVFENHPEIQSVTVEDGIRVIGGGAFQTCSGITDVTLADSVETIEGFAFSGCTSLESVLFPNSLRTIGNFAFQCCLALTEIDLPDSVTDIGFDVFSYCENLEYAVLPEGLKTIPDSLFYLCKSLTEITIPASVETIERIAFAGTGLTRITIPDSVTTIYDDAFSGCKELEEVTFSANLTTLGDSAFGYCPSLTEVNLPASLKTFNDAFYCCDSIQRYTVDPASKNYCSEDGVVYSKDKTTLFCYPPADDRESFAVPAGVATVNARAFTNCPYLTDISLPASVTAIHYNFSGCSGITRFQVDKNNPAYCAEDGVLYNKDKTELIRYPCASKRESYTVASTVTKLNRDAFEESACLHSVVLPDALTEIPYGAFSDCSALREITLPAGLETVGNFAFIRCDNLAYAFYAADEEAFNAVTVGDRNEALTENAVIHYRAKGHSYQNAVTKKATAENRGTVTDTCSVCGYVRNTAIPRLKTVALSKTAYTYNGKVQTPAVTVTDENGSTVSPENYTVTYAKGRKKTGRYTVSVVFRNVYSGKYDLTFDIKPKKATLKKVKSKKKKQLSVSWKKVAGATKYQLQVSPSKRFKKQVKTYTVKGSAKKKTLKKLKSKKKYYVRIRACKTVKVGGKTVRLYGKWSKKKATKIK